MKATNSSATIAAIALERGAHPDLRVLGELRREPVQPVSAGGAGTTLQGFVLFDDQSRPAVTFGYPTKAEAGEAAKLIDDALATAKLVKRS